MQFVTFPHRNQYPTQFEGVYYHDYLQLGQILNAQHPRSKEHGVEAHDETLFIIVHQVYELWFKQILHEVKSVIKLFSSAFIEERDLGIVVNRLNRVTEIQKILIDQIRVLETMSPADFLEFRGYLTPASGFQSVQFRVLENYLGLPDSHRINYHNTSYLNYFKEEHQQQLEETIEQSSLLKLVINWLERTPFIEFGDFDFWKEYRSAVEVMLARDREMTLSNPLLDEHSRDEQLKSQEKTELSFEVLFDENKYNELYAKGEKRLSYGACKAALFIYLYRDQPVLNLPYRFLTLLTDIDELLTTWRYRHVMMVQRMIGVKLGTGGSSGYYYLKSTLSDNYKVFLDLFHLSTYLIPNSQLPVLSDEVKKSLGFTYTHLHFASNSHQEERKLN